MRKVWFYSGLFTLFMWLGGIVPVTVTQAAPEAPEAHGIELANPEAAEGLGVTELPGHAGEEHGADAHGEGEVGLLDPQWGPFLWQLILFVLLIAFLGYFVWPPILKGLQQREEKIRADLQNAERANRDAQATLAEYKTQLAEAQREAQRIIDASKQDAQRVAAQLKEQAQAELTQMRQRAEADIRRAKEQAIADVYEQTANLATQVAAQILRREVRPEDHQQLVNQSLDALPQTAQPV